MASTNSIVQAIEKRQKRLEALLLLVISDGDPEQGQQIVDKLAGFGFFFEAEQLAAAGLNTPSDEAIVAVAGEGNLPRAAVIAVDLVNDYRAAQAKEAGQRKPPKCNAGDLVDISNDELLLAGVQLGQVKTIRHRFTYNAPPVAAATPPTPAAPAAPPDSPPGESDGAPEEAVKVAGLLGIAPAELGDVPDVDIVALPGIGPAALAKIRAWIPAPAA